MPPPHRKIASHGLEAKTPETEEWITLGVFAMVQGEKPVSPLNETTPLPLSVEADCSDHPLVGLVTNFHSFKFPAVLPFRSPAL